ncbi:MAG: hypothetical protein RRZ84_08035 [Romboutsia sp.]
MNFNIENDIVRNKYIESNAKRALVQYRLELASELNNFSSDQYPNPYLGEISTQGIINIGDGELIK